MNRRSFFKGLAAGIAAVAAPQIFLPKLDPFKWKRSAGLIVQNPMWITAKYEIWLVIAAKEYFGKWQFITEIPEDQIVKMPGPAMRGNEIDEEGNLIPIPPYIKV